MVKRWGEYRVEEARFHIWTRLAGARRRLAARDAVALTFDDGPDPTYTPAILDVLARHQVVATFFVTGDATDRHPELVVRMRDEGHAVANHSLSHSNLRYLRFRDAVDEIRKGRARIEKVAGHPVSLFRPPQGELSVGAALAVRLLGLRTYLYNREGFDWRPGVSAQAILDSMGTPQPGDILLLHDRVADAADPAAGDQTSTVEALDGLLGACGRRGLQFVTLDQDAWPQRRPHHPSGRALSAGLRKRPKGESRAQVPA